MNIKQGMYVVVNIDIRSFAYLAASQYLSACLHRLPPDVNSHTAYRQYVAFFLPKTLGHAL